MTASRKLRPASSFLAPDFGDHARRAFASSNVISRPVAINSIARALPTSRASRCVPPVPGSTPSATSGNRSCRRPSRDADVRRHRHFEPAADRVAVQRGDDQLGRLLERFSVSLACRQK